MAATHVTFRWLDILEKEFDKAFVDLDILIGKVNSGVAVDLPGHSTCPGSDVIEVTSILNVWWMSRLSGSITFHRFFISVSVLIDVVL